MDIVFGVITTFLIEVFKWSCKKFSKELTEKIIVLGVFILIFLWTALTQAHIISEQTAEFIIKVFAISTTTYVVVIKKIKPYLKKIMKM